MRWDMPRAHLSDYANQTGSSTAPVTPYRPAPAIVMQVPAPPPNYAAPQVALPIPVPWTPQAQPAPNINVTIQEAPKRPSTFFDVFVPLDTKSLTLPAEPAPAAPFQGAVASGTVGRAPVRAARARSTPPPVVHGEWTEAEKTELELAKSIAQLQGKYFKCTDAAHCVKSAIDSIGLNHVKTTLWRWPNVSGSAHSAVIVYPEWGTPETGVVIDQWWGSSFLRGPSYTKASRPGGFPYKGADWTPFDPDYGGGSAAGTTKRQYDEEVRRLLKKTRGE